MAVIIPPHTSQAGDPGHPDFHNSISDVLSLYGLALAQLAGSTSGSDTALISAIQALTSATPGYAGLLPAFNAAAYGADATGINDSTVAIQNALGAVPAGQSVFLPPGTYRTSAPLVIPSDVGMFSTGGSWGISTGNYGVGGLRLMGAIIKPSALFSGSAVIDLGKSSGGIQAGGQSLRGITIDGSSLPAGTVHGILAASVAGVKMRDCVVWRVTGDGIHAIGTTPDFTPPDFWEVSHCKFSASGGWGVNTAGLADSWFTVCESTGNTTGGWQIANGSDTRFTACRGESNGSVTGWSLIANAGFTGKVSLSACSGNLNGTGFAISGSGTGVYHFANVVAHDNATAAYTYSGNSIAVGLPNSGINPTFLPGSIPDPNLGITAWNFPSTLASGVTPALTSGNVYVMRVPLFATSVTITNVIAGVTTAGSSLTASQCFAAVFDHTGTRIGVTADQSGAWASAGLKSMALASGPFTGTWPFVYVAILSNGTTNPVFARGAGSGIGAAIVNLNASAANALCALNGTGQTTMPASLTYSSNVPGSGQGMWVGLS